MVNVWTSGLEHVPEKFMWIAAVLTATVAFVMAPSRAEAAACGFVRPGASAGAVTVEKFVEQATKTADELKAKRVELITFGLG